jgi:dihydrofolate reductase
MQATLLVAYDKNFGIGLGNGLPWPTIKEDLALFKQRTTGQAVIVGQTTYNTLPKRPLPGRKNIVLTRHAPPVKAEDCVGKNLVYVSSPTLALEIASLEKLHPFVIGGGQIYKLFLNRNLINEVIASEVKGEYDADCFFPIKLVDKFCGWDKQVVSEHEQFTVVRYITIDLMLK